MPAYGAKEMAAAWRTVRGNTIQIAEEIPEDKYDFVPAPGVRTVSELLRHMACATLLHFDFHRDKKVTTLAGYDFGALMGRMNGEASKPRSKAQIIALLKETGEEFATYLESLQPNFLDETFTDPAGKNPKSRMENLLGAKEHEMHHRAQLMTIERMLGITPHLTRQRMQRSQPAETAAAKA